MLVVKKTKKKKTRKGKIEENVQDKESEVGIKKIYKELSKIGKNGSHLKKKI